MAGKPLGRLGYSGTARKVRLLGLFLGSAIASGIGCGSSLNPSFLNLLDPTGSSATIDTAPGHLVIAFVNNATVDEALLDYLQREGGLDPATISEGLFPRMRLRVQVTFTDATTHTIEFISGSSSLVDARFDTSAITDLNQNDLDNTVVLCDVATVAVLQGSVDVFIPVEITSFQQTEVTNQQGGVDIVYQQREQFPPQFRPLEVDDVDEDGNVVLQRNVGTRDVPSPALSPRCGSVIAFVVDGVLTVPFLPEAGTDDPSFDVDDEPSEASIGGRYEFRVSVQ